MEGMSARDIFNGAFRQPPVKELDVSKQPARAGRVSVTGVSRIRPSFLDRLLQPTFSAQTVGQVAAEAREAGGRLQALGIAKQVAVELDTLSDGTLDVRLRCVDGGRLSLRTGVDVGGASEGGTASVVARLPNLWGAGEWAEAEWARGTRTAAAARAVLGIPLDGVGRAAEASLAQAEVDHRPYSGHVELRRLARMAVKAQQGPVSHEVAYALAWREVRGLGAAASPSLRALAGHSVKSSVTYEVALDSRDSHTVPTAGSLLRATAELAGLGGD
ncbi:hypothetical protein GGI21_005607, partial [Coemansia aciculifera]